MAHLFSLYTPNLETILQKCNQQAMCIFKDAQIYNRLVVILRLKAGELFILFDEKQHAKFILDSQTFAKKRVIVSCIKSTKVHSSLKRKVTLACGLVKRTAMESIAYTAMQMGVTDIVPLQTMRVERSWQGHAERARLKRIMITAAEQAKQYLFTYLHEPLALEDFASNVIAQNKVYFEYDGKPFIHFLQTLCSNSSSCIIVIGPEGGLTQQEQDMLDQYQFIKYSLTATTLRSFDAVTVVLGAVCSITS